MVKKTIPFLINLGDVIPARSKATLLNEMAMALVELIDIYGRKIDSYGKIGKVTQAFWPVRLIPLSDTRACVCSYLLNSQEKIRVGKWDQIPAKPDNVISGSDPESFLDSLKDYNDEYLDEGTFFKKFKRNKIVQEALFNTEQIGYFRNFFRNQYDLDNYNQPYFLLEGEPIAKSVDQIKIAPEIYDFVGLKDVKMLDNYADIIVDLCDKWIEQGKNKAQKFKGTKVDTSQEEKKLAMLNKELQKEKERDLKNSSEELIKSGKYKINDKTSDFYNNINDLKNAVGRLEKAITEKNLFLLDEAIKELNLQYKNMGNSISRYQNEINQLKSNLQKEKQDIERMHQQKITELETKIAEVEKEIDAKHQNLNQNIASAEDVIVKIKEAKQEALQNIESVKDDELTDVQEFFNDYTIEIKTDNVVVGIPIFIFYFIDTKTNKTTERAPILPVMIDEGSVVSTKVKDNFRDQLSKYMNKLTPMVNLVESEGDKSNLMETIKNLDTRLEESINDLRIKKIIKKKTARKSRDVINNLVW
ncbi:MAG: hypothetical protein ACOC44_09465 [Promethearchaeia archaeon]